MKEHRSPTGLSIIVNKDVEPTGQCFTCGVPFFSREEGERHMGPCARRHLEELQESKLENRIPIMSRDAWDREAEDYLQDVVGARMKREGRLTMKKNERLNG